MALITLDLLHFVPFFLDTIKTFSHFSLFHKSIQQTSMNKNGCLFYILYRFYRGYSIDPITG